MLVVGGVGGGKTTHPATHSPTRRVLTDLRLSPDTYPKLIEFHRKYATWCTAVVYSPIPRDNCCPTFISLSFKLSDSSGFSWGPIARR